MSAIKLGNSDITLKVGDTSVSAAYLGSVLVYSGGTTPPTPPPTPTGSTCYEVINDPITAYTATTYDSVYSFADSRWYMKNNLNQYEKYGIYDTGNTLSDLTYYNGKLIGVGGREYQYTGGSWTDVGIYDYAETSYTIDNTTQYTYQGQELSTTIKIPVADVEAQWGNVNLTINTQDGGNLHLITSGTYEYYNNSTYSWEYGTVTSDSDYYYFSLPTTQSVIINDIPYWASTPTHLITSQLVISVEYQEKDIPLAKVYQSVAAMEAEVCPTIGVGQYGVVGNDVYQYDSTEEWVTLGNHYKVFEKNNNGLINVVGCNSNSHLTTGDTKPKYFTSSPITEAVIGDCVVAIDSNAFIDCYLLKSINIPSGITAIWDDAFNGCYNVSSITVDESNTRFDSRNNCNAIIRKYDNTLVVGCRYSTFPSSVTKIGRSAFYNVIRHAGSSINIPSNITLIDRNAFDSCTGLKEVTIGDGIQEIEYAAFRNCSNLLNFTCLATNPPTFNSYAFNGTHKSMKIYVPSESVEAYKAASGWSDYASKIQAIPSS